MVIKDFFRKFVHEYGSTVALVAILAFLGYGISKSNDEERAATARNTVRAVVSDVRMTFEGTNELRAEGGSSAAGAVVGAVVGSSLAGKPGAVVGALVGSSTGIRQEISGGERITACSFSVNSFVGRRTFRITSDDESDYPGILEKCSTLRDGDSISLLRDPLSEGIYWEGFYLAK